MLNSSIVSYRTQQKHYTSHGDIDINENICNVTTKNVVEVESNLMSNSRH